MKKRMISLVLVLAMCLSLCPTVFADQREGVGRDIQPKISDDVYDIVALESDGENEFYLASREYENGVVEFLLIENDTIVSTAILNRNENIVRCLDDCNASAHYSTIELSECKIPNVALAAAENYSTVGNITYAYYDQGYASGTRKINLALSVTSSASRYNINGKYQSLASFASVLAGVLTLPGIVASALAAQVLSILSISVSVGSILIPDYYVKATEVENKWKLTTGSVTGYMTGSKFTFTHEYNGTLQTTYEGNYYTRASYTSKSSAFANELYKHVKIYWGGDGRVEVVSWG